MITLTPRLRDANRRLGREPFVLNKIPDDVIVRLCEYFAYLMYIGRKDINGDDWGDAFAKAVGGTHLASPLGIADISLGNIAWSAKTVKNAHPHSARKLRLISGRCSPVYSYNISNPLADIQQTGSAVLGIWNERINIAHDNYSDVRTIVLVRSDDLCSYCLFEEENHRYRTSDYEWIVNKQGNFEGFNIATGKKAFTWQPHGSQFTIHTQVPAGARRFRVRKPEAMPFEEAIKTINFDSSWVSFAE